jgi:hypothetical protein
MLDPIQCMARPLHAGAGSGVIDPEPRRQPKAGRGNVSRFAGRTLSAGTKGNDKALAAGVFLFLLSVYLLTFSGSLHSSDGQAMFSVTESLVRRGAYDINQVRWMGLQQGTFGLDGNLYCRKGLGTSLAALPLAWLGLVVPLWGVVQTSMLFNPLVTGLTGALIFVFVRRLSYGRNIALVTALIFGLGTLAWPYTKYFFSEPLTGLCLLAAAYFVSLSPLSKRRGLTWLAPLAGGFWLGLAVATRFANAALLPVYLGVLIASVLRQRGALSYRELRARPSLVVRIAWRETLLFLVPLLLWALIMAAYNYARFGNPLSTGYLPEESFSAPWLVGLAGLLVSPGKGIIFFSPVIVAALAAFPSFWRRHGLPAALVALVSAGYVLMYGKWFMWHGGFAWGPRFLVPILPLLCLPFAPLLESLRGFKKAGFWALFGASGAVQVLGLSVHFNLFQEGLLESGLPLFDPITFFDTRYSQLWGTLHLLSVGNLDFAWIRHLPQTALDWPALLTTTVLVGVCGWALAVVSRRTSNRSSRAVFILLPLALSVVSGTAFCLTRYANDGHADFVEMLGYLQANTQPSDVIIQNSPPETAVFQNHYKGRLASYGLFEGQQPLSEDTEGVLSSLSTTSPRVWLIPDDLPPQESSLDQWFLERGWSPAYYSFGGQRLGLYSRP